MFGKAWNKFGKRGPKVWKKLGKSLENPEKLGNVWKNLAGAR
jgi:hypothetical protein